MPTLLQLLHNPRIKKFKKSSSPKLKKNPQKKAVCLRVLTISPKKPNTANRRIIKANLTHDKARITAKITGESHNLQQHSTVLVKGARIHDLIGVNYSAVRGKYDLLGVTSCKTKRSLFGVKKNT